MDANASGAASDKCGHSAIGLTGINHDKFNKCLSGAVGIGAACSGCSAKTADLFDIHQEVLIIEARPNAKMLASALLFSALHLCSRH